MMAASAMAIAPVVVLAVLFRKYLMRGFSEGMTKG